MRLYHMSDTLKLGQTMELDFKKYDELAEPFVQALMQSKDCYLAMILNAKYLRAVLGKFGMKDMASYYTKWACEGAFEYIRRTEFPNSYSRMKCNYFFDNLTDIKRLYEVDWGNASAEERERIHLFEIEVDDTELQKRDMLLYDQAFDMLYEDETNIDFVFDCARKYFGGEQSDAPVWEILSDKPAFVAKDISEYIHR